MDTLETSALLGIFFGFICFFVCVCLFVCLFCMCVCVLIDSKVYQLFIIVWSFAVSLFASLLVLFSFFVFFGVFVCEFDT